MPPWPPGRSGLDALVLGELGRKDLQGDVSIETGVFGQIDLTHSAGSQLPDDAVMGKLLRDVQ
jgi:hypothetical protein